MLKQEFSDRTGFYPSADIYAIIENKYLEMDVGKDRFCKMYKNNDEGLAEYIQSAADDKLVRDIEALEAKKDAIKAKVATAKAQKHMNQVLSGGDKAAASIDAFERYEAKADKMLDEAAAMTELNKTADDNTADSLLDKYKNGGSADVDDELEKMKKELGL